MIGSVAAFAVLNTVAVLFGAAISAYLPQEVVLAVVAVLFLLFGIQAFRAEDEDEDDELKVGAHLIASVFLLIFLPNWEIKHSFRLRAWRRLSLL